MVAALPYVDLFAPVHNLQSLKDLVRYLMTLRGVTAVRRPPRRDPPASAGAEPGRPTRDEWLQRFGVLP
jgi:hypothetical protein